MSGKCKKFRGFCAPCSSVLVHCLDDLLLSSDTQEACKQDTRVLLLFWAANGHHTSKENLQLVSPSVNYLGHILTNEGRSIGPERIASIQAMPKFDTKR